MDPRQEAVAVPCGKEENDEVPDAVPVVVEEIGETFQWRTFLGFVGEPWAAGHSHCSLERPAHATIASKPLGRITACDIASRQRRLGLEGSGGRTVPFPSPSGQRLRRQVARAAPAALRTLRLMRPAPPPPPQAPASS